MAPNVWDSGYFDNQYIDSDYNFMHSLIIKSKHLLINSVSKAKLNGRFGLLIDNFERKFSSNQELIVFVENKEKNSNDLKDDKKDKRRDGLLKITEVPMYLRFNPWILRGYRRPDLSVAECLMSLSYFHNETINIMSHSIPLLYCLSILYSSIWWQTIGSVFLSFCHFLGLLSWAFGSSTYHLFMNHRGHNSYDRLLGCDMFGIWVTQSVGAVPTIYASLYAFSIGFQHFFIGLYAVLSIFSLRDGLFADTAWKRPASFTFLFIMRIIALVLRIQTKFMGNNKSIQIFHVIMQDLWPLIGAFISAARIPERFWPGVFDYFLNSHNIMHCFVVFGAIHMHWAFNYDLQWLTDNEFKDLY